MKKIFTSNSLLLLALTFVTPAHAWMAWSEAETVHSGMYKDTPQISLNDHNQAMVIWTDNQGSDTETKEQVLAKLYSEGWQSQPPFTAAEASYLYNPQVAFNNSGHAIAAWSRYSIDNLSLQVAKYADGAWGQSEAIFTLPHRVSNMINLQIALNDAGDGVVIFTTQKEAGDDVHAAIYENGEWQPIQSVSADPSTPSTEVRRTRKSKVALNASGDMVLVWELSNNAQSMIQAAYRKKGNASWSEPQVISERADLNMFQINHPDVALNDNGDVIAVWSQPKDHSAVGSATFSDGKWSPPAVIDSEFVGGGVYPSVALNNHGNAFITWQSNSKLYAIHKCDGNWGQPTVISQEGWNCWDHKLAFNDADHAVVAFNASEDLNDPSPFPPPPEKFGFFVAFAHERWGTPQLILPSVIDVKLNQKDQAILLGTGEDTIQSRHGSF